jgi:phosphinothricin acetyltransferase
MVRNIKKEDAQQICNIYNYYVKNTTITFEEEPVSSEEMEKRIAEITLSLPWIVYQEKDRINGYAYASKWKGRYAYRFSVESTVYIENNAIGRGIGTRLYEILLEELKDRKFHAVIGGIAIPNEKSQRLHEKFGFKKVAHFYEVGYKFNKWIDVEYWELILNKQQ